MNAISILSAEGRTHREVTLIGAASNIGIRPYDDGTPRHLDRAPAVLREAGLAERLHATDLGDLEPEPYRDFTKPDGRPRNDTEVAHYCAALAERVNDVVAQGRFPIVLGGDCSVVLGGLWGLVRAGVRDPGLVYLDGHADFAAIDETRTGSVASMCLALAVGRGDLPLAHLAGDHPLVRSADVALVGRRDEAQPNYGHAALHRSAVLDIPHARIGAKGYEGVAAEVLERVARSNSDGFWIHIDADVLSPSIMPAVDSPEPGGPEIAELGALVAELVSHPRAVGMELTIYDPNLDPDRACAARLVTLLEYAITSGGRVGRSAT